MNDIQSRLSSFLRDEHRRASMRADASRLLCAGNPDLHEKTRDDLAEFVEFVESLRIIDTPDPEKP